MVVFGIPVRVRHLAYLVGDVAMALLAVQLGWLLRLLVSGVTIPSLPQILRHSTGASVFFIVVHITLLYVFDAYSVTHDFRKLRGVLRLWMTVSIAAVLLMSLSYALPDYRLNRGISALSFLSFGVLLTAWRVTICSIRPVRSRLRSLIVGAGAAGKEIAQLIASEQEYAFANDVRGFIDDSRADAVGGVPIVGTSADLPRLVTELGVRQLVVAIPGRMKKEMAKTLLRCKAAGVQIVDMPTLYKRLTGRLPIDHVADSWIIFGPGFADRATPLRAVARLTDVILSVVGLVLTAPVILLAIGAVKVTSRGPAFYSQDRLGLNERPFAIHKLRTMVADAESATGAVWSQGSDDPRVTRVGRFLRRSRLDEIPQLWNVLKGEMAIVGPRPEREKFVRELAEEIPYYELRFAVKPGVTGWAQVMYRYGASVEDSAVKLQYELYAIQEMTPVLYVLILLKTFQTVLVRPGS